MDQIDNDMERCFDEYESMKLVRKDIKRNEQKLDRIYNLMELNAFGQGVDQPSDEDDYETNSQNPKSSHGVTYIPEKDRLDHFDEDEVTEIAAKTNIKKKESETMLLNPNDLKEVKSSKVISEIESSRSKIVSRSKKKESSISIQKLNAVKIMFVKLEGKVDDINNRLTQREEQDNMFSNTVQEVSKNIPNYNNKGTSSLMQAEFISIKHLISRHQMSIAK